VSRENLLQNLVELINPIAEAVQNCFGLSKYEKIINYVHFYNNLLNIIETQSNHVFLFSEVSSD